MRIVYDSKTGNVKRFVEKLGMDCVQINSDQQIDEPFILITYTTGFGQVPQTTKDYLRNKGHLLQGVVSSGNMNWGNFYGRAADLISEQYNVPILMKLELSGTTKDVVRFKQEVDRIVYSNCQMDSA